MSSRLAQSTYSKFQSRHGYKMRPCLKNKQKKTFDFYGRYYKKRGELSIHFELHSKPVSSQKEKIPVKHLFSLFFSGTHKIMTSILPPPKRRFTAFSGSSSIVLSEAKPHRPLSDTDHLFIYTTLGYL